MGGIEYSVVDWKNDNSRWVVNLNPMRWRLGLNFKL
jgi:hypothetical protein